MEFYESIARYYDDIFPYNSIQRDFVLAMAGNQCEKKYLLDVGCGTGNLVLELSKDFKDIIGIDYDRDMVRMAASKIERSDSNINFQYLNMLDIATHFEPSVFDAIICFGNTLVHLAGPKEIETFLRQTRGLLKPGGKLLLQIVNFDRILGASVKSLPLIENEQIKFERYYIYHEKIRIIDFETVLTVKKVNRVIKNCVQLYPLLKKESENILINCGYDKIFYYGSFKRELLSENSIPLIIEAY